MNASTKRCRACGQVKERGDFYPHNRDGLRTMCKACQRLFQRAQVVVYTRHRAEVQDEFARLLDGDEAVAS